AGVSCCKKIAKSVNVGPRCECRTCSTAPFAPAPRGNASGALVRAGRGPAAPRMPGPPRFRDLACPNSQRRSIRRLICICASRNSGPSYLALHVRDYVNALVLLGRLALVDTLGLRQLPV